MASPQTQRRRARLPKERTRLRRYRPSRANEARPMRTQATGECCKDRTAPPHVRSWLSLDGTGERTALRRSLEVGGPPSRTTQRLAAGNSTNSSSSVDEKTALGLRDQRPPSLLSEAHQLAALGSTVMSPAGNLIGRYRRDRLSKDNEFKMGLGGGSRCPLWQFRTDGGAR